MIGSDGTPRAPRCWCGNPVLLEFSKVYGACPECGTLVSLGGLRPEEAEVRDDEHDFYGRGYWFAWQRDTLGFPDIYERASLDLPERCLRWLRTLLTYRLPPGRVLELGSGHGAFVALMRAAGFDATGLELSPWVVEFARATFQVPMLEGPVERQGLAERSLDAVVLNDVLEHLVEPLGTMRHCATLLETDGFVVAQTPCYPEDQGLAALTEANHPFLAMLQEREHLYLFSQRAVRRLFAEAGLPVVRFEPALFSYDMVAVASRHPLTPTAIKHREEALLASASARHVRSLLELDDRWRGLDHRVQELSRQLEEVEGDRQERIAMIKRLNVHIDQTSRDYDTRQKIIIEQQATIERVAAANEAQLHVISDQQATIDKLVQQREYLSEIETRVRQSRLGWLFRLLRVV